MYESSISLVAQGAKPVLFGDDAQVYNERHFLITAVHLPTVVQIIGASRENLYLGLRLQLDILEVSHHDGHESVPVS